MVVSVAPVLSVRLSQSRQDGYSWAGVEDVSTGHSCPRPLHVLMTLPPRHSWSTSNHFHSRPSGSGTSGPSYPE